MSEAEPGPEILTIGPLSFCPATSVVGGANGQVRLPANHAAILERLMRHHDGPVPSATLAGIVCPLWPGDSTDKLLGRCLTSLAALVRRLTRGRLEIRGRPHMGNGTVAIHNRSAEVRKGTRSVPR